MARTDADRSEGRSSPFQHTLLGLYDSGSTQLFCAFPNTAEGVRERDAAAKFQVRSLLPAYPAPCGDHVAAPTTTGTISV